MKKTPDTWEEIVEPWVRKATVAGHFNQRLIFSPKGALSLATTLKEMSSSLDRANALIREIHEHEKAKSARNADKGNFFVGGRVGASDLFLMLRVGVLSYFLWSAPMRAVRRAWSGGGTVQNRRCDGYSVRQRGTAVPQQGEKE